MSVGDRAAFGVGCGGQAFQGIVGKFAALLDLTVLGDADQIAQGVIVVERGVLSRSLCIVVAVPETPKLDKNRNRWPPHR